MVFLSQELTEKIITVIYINHRISKYSPNLTFPSKKIIKIRNEITEHVPQFYKSLIDTSVFIEKWIRFLEKQSWFIRDDQKIHFNPAKNWNQFAARHPQLVCIT